MTLPCLILAGGLATRMRPATERIPKALLSVGGRPFIDIQLERLRQQGAQRVIFSVGYRGNLIRAHVGNGSEFGLTVDYVDDGPTLLGTGGGVRRAVEAGLVGDAFFVLNGDSYLTLDFASLEEAFLDADCPALMTVFHNQGRWDASNVVMVEGRIALYDKQRPKSRRAEMDWIDYGLSVFRTDLIRERIPPAIPFDLADLLHDLSVEGRLGSYEVSHRFYEVGSPAGLADLEAHLSRATR